MNSILGPLMPDVYAGIAAPASADDASGWDGDNAIFDLLVDKHKPKVIIEVGTWKGQSAFTMAEACRKRQLQTAIICVDTWLGSPEHWITWPEELKRRNGYPQLYYLFLENVVRRNLCETIVPLPTTSTVAAALLDRQGVRADLIYIDANHEYDAVLSDMEHYFRLLAPGGLLFGHDLQEPDIVRAVNSFCLAHELKGWARHEAFWMIA